MPNKINGQSFPNRLKSKKWIGTASTAGATTSSATYVKLGSVRVDNFFTASEVLTVTSMVTKTGTNGTKRKRSDRARRRRCIVSI